MATSKGTPLQAGIESSDTPGAAREDVASPEGSSGSSIDFALEAFCTGYAVHGSEYPSPRARTALAASYGVLEAFPGPDALALIEAKATTEGLYANIYQRRDRVWMVYDRRVRKWTQRLAADLPVDAMVAEIQKAADEESADARRQRIKDAIVAALFATITRYADLVSEARNLVAAGMAEGTALGMTAAAALQALLAGNPVPDLDILQRDTLKQLQTAITYYQDLETVLQDMVNGLAGDVARTTSGMVADGSSDDDLGTAIVKTVAAGAGASFYLDSHIHAAFALAILAAIKRANQLVAFVTVGDDRVCPACIAAEDGNPWKPDEVPPIPNHGGCRCWYAPAH